MRVACDKIPGFRSLKVGGNIEGMFCAILSSDAVDVCCGTALFLRRAFSHRFHILKKQLCIKL